MPSHRTVSLARRTRLAYWLAWGMPPTCLPSIQKPLLGLNHSLTSLEKRPLLRERTVSLSISCVSHGEPHRSTRDLINVVWKP